MSLTPEIATDTSTPHSIVDHGPGVKIPPMGAFSFGFLVAIGLHIFEPLRFFEGSEVRTLAVVGWGIVGVGVAMFLWALRVLFLARTGIVLQKPATMLMRQGPYAWSRNPQYLAFVAIYLGAALVTNTVWPLLLLAPVVAIVVVLVIRREERYLRRTFGAAYDEYCRDVGRWL